MIENPTETKEPFVIDSEDKAAWLLRKLAAIRAEQEGIREATEKRLQELDSDYNRLWSKYGQQAESWGMGECERRYRKTITLPLAGASLSFRTVPGGLRATKTGTKDRADMAVTLGFTTTTEPATLPDLKRYEAHALKHFTETGEEMPGYEFVPERESFAVDLGISKLKKGGTPAE